MEYLARKLREFGLKEVRIDKTGNALGKLIGNSSDKKFVLISAHGDTACEAPLPIKVIEKGDHLFAHGICDNTAGVTAVLTFLEYLRAENIKLQKNYLIAFTVGEEGLGAKRGRYAFRKNRPTTLRQSVEEKGSTPFRAKQSVSSSVDPARRSISTSLLPNGRKSSSAIAKGK